MANNNFDNNSDKEESKFKNTHNAEINYRYFKSIEHLAKKGLTVKPHNGMFESLTNPDGKTEMLWKVIDPIYITFSWKDKNNNNCRYTISFHINENEFKNKIVKFFDIEKPKPTWQSYYN